MTPTTSLRLLASTVLFAASVASAQTKAPAAAPHRAATAAARPAGSAACAKLPELSAKIPAVPAGSPCAKSLYTIVVEPNVKLEDVSPMAGPGLRETLGIETTRFSLNYIDTKIGTGELAAPHKFYTIHYTGYLLDGTQFDSSVGKEPITIQYGGHQVIPGWDTGFDGMHVGGKRRLFIPFQLAYGATAHGSIPAKSELVFDVELVSQSDEKPASKPTPPTPPAGAAKPAVTNPSTPSTTPATSPAAPPPATSTTPAKPTATPDAAPKK